MDRDQLHKDASFVSARVQYGHRSRQRTSMLRAKGSEAREGGTAKHESSRGRRTEGKENRSEPLQDEARDLQRSDAAPVSAEEFLASASAPPIDRIAIALATRREKTRRTLSELPGQASCQLAYRAVCALPDTRTVLKETARASPALRKRNILQHPREACEKR